MKRFREQKYEKLVKHHRALGNSYYFGHCWYMEYQALIVILWSWISCLHCCGSGSGIRCLFYSWIRDLGSGSRSGIRIRDEQTGLYFLELRNHFLGLKWLNSLLWIRDPGWKKFGSGIWDGKRTVHRQNVRFQNVRCQNVRFQNVWNVRFTKRQVTKRPVEKKSIDIFCTCGWWKSAGSVAMFVGKVMAVFYSLF